MVRRRSAEARSARAPRAAEPASAPWLSERAVAGLQVAALAAVVVAFVVHARRLDARFQDDAFISFRYAKNLAEGRGLVWNPGERVEGYTNFLWTVLLAVPFAITKAADPVAIARALSVGAGCAAIGATFLAVRHLEPKARLLPLVPPALLAGNWAFVVNTVTGLETTFFAALVTIGVTLLAREVEDLRPRGASFVLAAAALTRPEAVGLFLGLAALVAVGHRGRGPEARRHLAWLVAPFAAIVGAHTLFRLAYYGAIVPNTFVAKVGASLPPGMDTRASYGLGFVSKAMDLLGVLSTLAVVFVVGRALRHAPSRIVAAGAAFAGVTLAVSGADFMIGYRYLAPYLPLIYVCAALGAGVVAARLRRRDPSSTGLEVEAALAVIAGFACAKGWDHTHGRVRPFEELRRRVIADSSQALGEWLGAHLPKDALVVTLDIGELGYRSGLPVLDLSGLTDPAIARRPGNVLDRSLDLDYVFGRDPGAFVLISRRPGPNKGPGPAFAYWPPGASRAIVADPRMRDRYAFVARWPDYDRLAPDGAGSYRPLGDAEHAPGETFTQYYLELWLRRDLSPGDAR